MNIDKLYEQLLGRLPEIEWKLSQLGSAIHKMPLQKGLFRTVTERTAEAFVAELKKDLETLQQQTNERRSHHLAEQLGHKIHVLVQMCHQQQKDNAIKAVSRPFGLQAMSTRQQYLISLKHEMVRLKAQQQALQCALESSQSKEDMVSVLVLQKELGEVQRQLTLVEEL